MTLVELIACIDNCTKNVFDKEKDIFDLLTEIMPDLVHNLEEFLSLIPKLNQIGFQISEEVVLSQLQRMNSAYEKKDRVAIFDSLRFEICDTLSFYSKIKKIMDEE